MAVLQRAVFLSAAFAVCIAASCGTGQDFGRCRIESELPIFESVHSPTAVSIAAIRGAGFAVAFSAGAETFVVRLDERLAEVGPVTPLSTSRERVLPKELGEANKAFWPRSTLSSFVAQSIDIADAGGGRALVVLVGGDAAVAGAHAAVIDLSTFEIDGPIRLGPAGRLSSTISVAIVQGQAIVAWHDGDVDHSSVRLARLALRPLALAEERVMPGGPALTPAIVAAGQGAVVAWAQPNSDLHTPRFEIAYATCALDLTVGAPRTASTSSWPDPAPALSSLGDEIGLVFRDDEDQEGMADYFFVPVAKDGSSQARPARIARADGFRGPALTTLKENFIGAAVRTFSHELQVSLSRFDRSGKRLGGELQIYSDGTSFVRLDAASDGTKVALVYAEEQAGASRITASSLRCGQ